MAMSSISTAIFQGADKDVDVTTGIMVEPIAEPTVMMLTRKPRIHPPKINRCSPKKRDHFKKMPASNHYFFRGYVSFLTKEKKTTA